MTIEIVLLCLIVVLSACMLVNSLVHARNCKTYDRNIENAERCIDEWKQSAKNKDKELQNLAHIVGTQADLLRSKMKFGLIVTAAGIQHVLIDEKGQPIASGGAKI